MKCSCSLYSLLLLVLQLGLVRNSVCQAIQYRDIVRNLYGNNQPVSQQPSALLSHQAVQPVVPAAFISNSRSNTGSVFDARVSDFIAGNVLKFAHYVGQQLGEQNFMEKAEVFSPVSIMSALALLMLGAKGRSYEELKPVFGLNNDAELLAQPSKFHTEFGLMLEDLQRHGGGGDGLRQNAYWRQELSGENMRNEHPTQPMEHITKIANGLFTQLGFSLNPDYKSTINSIYHAMLAPVDFAQKPGEARKIINQWVGSSTCGKIPNILAGNLARDTNVMMASTLYFRGFWEKPFLQAATVQDSFFPNGVDQPPISAKIMATAGFYPFYDAVEYDCRIIGLPYQDNVTTMYVIMPNQSSRKKLNKLQRMLDAGKIEDMISRMVKKSAVIALPKMHLKRSVNMKDTLNRLGITEIFASGISDLSLIGSKGQGGHVAQAQVPQKGISTSRTQQIKPVVFPNPASFNRFGESDESSTPSISTRWLPQYEDGQYRYSTGPIARRRIAKRQVPTYYRDTLKNQNLNQLENDRKNPTTIKSELFVEDIVHQVDIEINEQGTEAAAATLTYLRRAGTDVLFRADAPFIFMIRHDPTKLVTFYGIVNEPV